MFVLFSPSGVVKCHEFPPPTSWMGARDHDEYPHTGVIYLDGVVYNRNTTFQELLLISSGPVRCGISARLELIIILYYGYGSGPDVVDDWRDVYYRSGHAASARSSGPAARRLLNHGRGWRR